MTAVTAYEAVEAPAELEVAAAPEDGRSEVSHLSGQQKVAIVLAQLDAQLSSAVMKALGDEDAILMATEMAKLPPLNRDLILGVMEEFAERLNLTREAGPAGAAQALKILASVIGEEKAKEVMAQQQGSTAVGPLAFLANADPQHVVPHLAEEHPQTVAVVLAHMPPNDGARLLDAMPADLRAEVAVRIATMERVSPDAIGAAATQLASRLRGLRSSGPAVPGGIPALVELLNRSEGGIEKQVLGELEARDPELADAVRAKMFTFEDVLALDDKTLQVVLRNVEMADLALALRGVTDDPEAVERMAQNLSERGRAELTEELDVMGSVRASLVNAAQSGLVRTVRELEANGTIVIGRQDDELV